MLASTALPAAKPDRTLLNPTDQAPLAHRFICFGLGLTSIPNGVTESSANFMSLAKVSTSPALLSNSLMKGLSANGFFFCNSLKVFVNSPDLRCIPASASSKLSTSWLINCCGLSDVFKACVHWSNWPCWNLDICLFKPISDIRYSIFSKIRSKAWSSSIWGASLVVASAISDISLPRVSITLADACIMPRPKYLSVRSLRPRKAASYWSALAYSWRKAPSPKSSKRLLFKNKFFTSSILSAWIILLYIFHAAAFISLLLYLKPSITALNLPAFSEACAIPKTVSRAVSAFIPSVINGAGLPTTSPFLIAVVSAILRATLAGGMDCLGLPSPYTSASQSTSSGLLFNFLAATSSTWPALVSSALAR